MAKTTFDDIKRALWAGANTFRDNIDASNYKDYVLSMFFVKYLSDTFDESVKELEKEYSGIRLERQKSVKLLSVLRVQMAFSAVFFAGSISTAKAISAKRSRRIQFCVTS